VIATAKMDVEERLQLSRMFVPEMDNWAVCDAFCSTWTIKKAEREKLWQYCRELFGSNDEFKMRVASVMMQYHFLDDKYIDEILRIHTTKDHPGYYYRMGAGWTLSTCFIYYQEKTERELFDPSLNNDTRNKAVQKIIESARVGDEAKARLRSKKEKL
jgi:3-methyladenine DNA glycosylase AlkD